MTDGADRFLVEWHRMVAERDIGALPHLLADDVCLGAPPYWEPFRDRDLVEHLLGLILETIQGFTYHREWRNGREIALEFRGRVAERELQGIDLISLDDTCRVRKLDVLMRPANAIAALQQEIAPRMAAYLAERAG